MSATDDLMGINDQEYSLDGLIVDTRDWLYPNEYEVKVSPA